MLILGIETSCDETAAAIIEGKNAGTQNFVSVRSNIVSSQINIHKKYNGVVPEVAAREHVLNILPVINEALEKAKIKRQDAAKKINAIAVSVGPGLITSLIVGIETAKVLSCAWDIPIVPINHVEGHIYANFIGANSKSEILNSKHLPADMSADKAGKAGIPNPKSQIQNIEFPAIVLTVSGGHTMLILMEGHGKYKTIGETRDDAAGEAFDKAAKLMGIGYPGGPIAADYAEKFIEPSSRNSKFQITNNKQISKDKSKIILPRPMIHSNNYDFSFSGLKTALLYELKKDKNWKKKIPEYCHEFQQSVIDVLIYKTIEAAKKYNIKTIMLTGGVAANKELRKQMKKAVKIIIPNSLFLIPKLTYTTDNAVMIAAAGYFNALDDKFINWQKLKVDPNLRLK
ncbi:tRNA (adenosine(37)-N6)-threonylcarbamoyltransferase complex transferase subunit TsaD [Candidatus Parcubacteria bacterium]|nr:tRNA (adenosine(37)-N6)-threonylcarbamoyltransferase complex transferase subunit TsaD [Candidatus Parcubacteria bacterium]